MNENFMIPDISSLYNIQSIYNKFVEEISNCGFENLIINPEVSEVVDTDPSGIINSRLIGWESDGIGHVNTVFYFDDTDYLRQPLYLEKDQLYTLVIDLKNSGDLQLNLNNGQYNHCEIIDITTNQFNLNRVITPALDEFNLPTRHQVAYTFQTGDYTETTLYPAKLEFAAGGVSSTVEFYNVSLVKGTFAINQTKKRGIFTDYVRYKYLDGGTFEISMDGGENYYDLLTTRPTDVDSFVDILVNNEIIYTKQEIDARFLRKDIPDAASRLITFLEGIRSEDDVNLSAASKLLLDGGSLIVNNSQQVGTGQPTRNFSLTVKRADAADAIIRYNEGVDMWEFNHGDGQWRILGSAQGTGAGTGSSELEYYAEILQNSGYRWAYYDLFDVNDEDESVLNYSNNLTWDGDNTNYFVLPGATGPFILTTRNIWNPDHAGNQYTLFIHCLTNQVDMTSGINVSYALDGAGGGEPWSPSDPAWIDVQQNEFITPIGNIDELYLKFEITNPDVVFHSFGVFYGVWSASYSTYTRLREYYIVPSAQGAGAQITVPNGGYYSIGQKALEVYLNRVRLVEGIDYTETSNSTIQLNNSINTNDVVEFYEKYGYADFSADNQVLIQNHINNPNGHGTEIGVNQIWTDVSGSRVFDTPYQNTDGRPITVAISGDVNLHLEVSADDVTYLDFHSVSPVIIPADHYYKVTDLGGGTLTAWYELR